MLKFDLNQNPPTAEEIAAERQEIDRRISVFKRKAWGISIALIVAVAAALVACWLLGKEFASAGAVAGIVVGATAIDKRRDGYFFGVVAVLVAWIAASIAAGSAAALVSGAFTFFVVGVAASAIKDRYNGYESRLSSLAAIDPSDCDRLIADCLADPLCEAYRQEVAALGRKPVVAEVKMIRGWVAGADAREKERLEGIACALVSSREPLPSEADVVLKTEEGKSC